MQEFTYSSWIEEKTALALGLAQGCCGGTYPDGAIILCTSISAMSSLMWVKKKRTDSNRFTEIVARFYRTEFDPSIVSAPLLSQDDNSLKQPLGVSDLAIRYTGKNDKSEDEVVRILRATGKPSEDCIKLARKYSYARLLYEHIRCGFIHSYDTTDFATSDDALKEIFDPGKPMITYVNYLAAQNMRKIHFPLEWIAEVAKSVATGMDSKCNQLGKHLGENLDLAIPSTWWIDGG